jgi:acyl-CoA thioester hydrolase
MILHSRREPGHVLEIRVYYEDTDAGGVVYHANYLRFAERARTEALRVHGVPHAALVSEYGLMFMVRRVKAEYAEPARLDDSLLVITWPRAVRAASVELSQRFYRNGTARPLVQLDLQLACVRLADLRPARLPARWRTALEALAGGHEGAPAGAQ